MCVPTASDAVVNVAVVTPPRVARVPVPSTSIPSRNVTTPEGVPAPGADTLTVAVNVTDCPNADGFTDETHDVLVLSWATVSPCAAEVLAWSSVSPVYAAVIEWTPTPRELVVNVAVVTP